MDLTKTWRQLDPTNLLPLAFVVSGSHTTHVNRNSKVWPSSRFSLPRNPLPDWTGGGLDNFLWSLDPFSSYLRQKLVKFHHARSQMP